MTLWRDAKREKPDSMREIVMIGDSHNRTIGRFIINGYYNSVWHPYSPWHNARGDTLEECGWSPNVWTYAEELLP